MMGHKTANQNNRTKVASVSEISVLLIEEEGKPKSILRKTLREFQYQVICYPSLDDGVLAKIESYNPTLLVLATDFPSESTLQSLAEISQLLPLPIVIFAENDSPSVIQNAIKAGVSAYVVHEILPQRIKSIISVANERFKEMQALRNELKQTKAQLESRKLIERAKGYIMQQKQIPEGEAYSALRKMAMDQGTPMAMVAQNIIDVCALLEE